MTVRNIMNVDRKFIDEVELQLEEDILHFAWLVKIARQLNPDHSESECTKAVLDAVARLHHDGTVVVGNAREIDGMVVIDIWPDSNHKLRDRMESAIADSDKRDRDFCFWIQLTKHLTK